MNKYAEHDHHRNLMVYSNLMAKDEWKNLGFQGREVSRTETPELNKKEEAKKEE